MEWKMFGIKGKLVSAKQKVFKVFRLIGALGKEGPNVSSPTPVFAVAPYESVNSLPNYSLARAQPKTFNLQAYTLAKQRMHEIETEKAMVISLMRHDKWKPGGPQ